MSESWTALHGTRRGASCGFAAPVAQQRGTTRTVAAARQPVVPGHGSGLGKVRWVVERTISSFKGLRRMRVRYDRADDIMEAWKSLAMSVITFRLWHQELATAN